MRETTRAMANFNNIVRSLIQFSDSRDAALERALEEVLTKFRAQTGTIHLLDTTRNLLILKVGKGLPPQVREITKEIPIGKGIAGECAATGKPVTMCNLQTDTSGVAKPGAKATGVGGTLCVPMLLDGKLVGTLGIGTKREYTFRDEETRMLTSVAKVFAEEMLAPSRS